MKKVAITIISFWVIMVCANTVSAQSAKEAIRSLQKLQAKAEAGISIRDYRAALGDALFEVKLFLDSDEAKKNPQLADAVWKAMDYYKTATDTWGSLGVQISLEKGEQELKRALALLPKK